MTGIDTPRELWTRAMLRLGLVLAAIAIVPVIIDLFLLRGAAALIASLCLFMVGPLAILSLAIGGMLWVWGRLRG